MPVGLLLVSQNRAAACSSNIQRHEGDVDVRVFLHLAVLLGLACSAQAQEALTFGAPVTRNIAGGETHSYTFAANAGDLVAGPAVFQQLDGVVQFLDHAGNRIPGVRVRQWFVGASSRRVGLVAPVAGTYLVRIVASGAGQGAYTLTLERVAVAARMAGVSVSPKDLNTSDRIRQLARDLQQGRREAADQFWRERAGDGPLVEPIPDNDRDQLVTFVWREAFETHNVLVSWELSAVREDDYYMNRLPNTDVWHKTIKVRRGARFTYSLVPNHRSADWLFTATLDPLNPRVSQDDPSSLVDQNSVLELPGAPDESWFRRTPVRRGTVEPKRFKSELLKNERDVWIYTPPGYTATAGPYPLLVLFDGEAYMRPEFNKALLTLDNLIAGERIRPVVVCFINSVNRAVDQGLVGAGVYGDAIVRELLPQLRSAYALSMNPRDNTIGGFSQGGLGASLIALRHSDVFGNVLSQSGNFRARTAGSEEPSSIARLYLDAPRQPVRFYIETGLYELAPPAGSLPMHELALDYGITAANRHFRDVLIAKGYDVTYRETAGAHESVHWRATLADALMTLLKPAQ